MEGVELHGNTRMEDVGFWAMVGWKGWDFRVAHWI